jgi:hypothetical protein
VPVARFKVAVRQRIKKRSFASVRITHQHDIFNNFNPNPTLIFVPFNIFSTAIPRKNRANRTV